MEEPAQVWERQSWETPKAWEGFQTYRDLGRQRSITTTCEALGRPEGYRGQLERWSKNNDWVNRVLKYDQHLDRINRVTMAQAQRENYQYKIARHKEQKEAIGRSIIAASAKILNLLQVQLAKYDKIDTPMRGGELAALFKSAQAGVEVGASLIDEALSLEKSEHINSEVEIEDILTDGSAEDLVREYQKIIDGFAIEES